MALLDVYRTRVSQDVELNLKRKTREIVRAYRHSWDIFSELIQNSVDAINRRHRILNDPGFYLYDRYREQFEITSNQSYRGKIKIRYDATTRTITIEDNGVGIENNNLERFLLPDETGKIVGKEYGFKGYGLTFVAFISRQFHIKSRQFLSDNTYEMSLNNLFDWLADDANAMPFPAAPIPTAQVATNELNGTDVNTVVSVRLEDNYETRFPAVASLNSILELVQSQEHWDRFEYVLRSRTAIGNTRTLFNQPPVVPIDVTLEIVFPDNTTREETIPYRFYHPRDHSEIRDYTYDFPNYVQMLSQASFDRVFRGLYHYVTRQSVGVRNPIMCDFAITAVSSTRLTNIHEDLRLAGDVDLSYGVYLSIDGMPTGIRLGAWRGHEQQRYYVVVDAWMDISNQLDPGRKGISEHYANLIIEKAWEIVRDTRINSSDTFSRYAGRFLDHGRSFMLTQAQDFMQKVNDVRQEGQTVAQNEPELLQKLRQKTPLQYFPSDEQEVIALFYSLLSLNHIKGYNTVYLSGKAIYDAAFDYEIDLGVANIHPNDSMGIGQFLVDELRRNGVSRYVHRERYPGVTQCAELCVEFKPTIGHFLQEVVMRSGRSNKQASDIDLLIVWDHTIPTSIPSGSYTIGEIQGRQRWFHSTTHKLGLTGARFTEIFCIVLKDVIESIP